MLVATRKGLLQLARKDSGWSIVRISFPGVAVTATLKDARDGTLYAMLKHGHFGSKLHRSDDDGRLPASWSRRRRRTGRAASDTPSCRRRRPRSPRASARISSSRRRGSGPAS